MTEVDHVCVNVRPSDDDFSECDQVEVPYNSTSDSEQKFGEELDSDSSDSVQIKCPSNEDMEKARREELKLLTTNPYFQDMVKDMVDVGVKAALAKEKPKTVSQNTPKMQGKFFKTVTRNNNPKSPSDATIYAPALKLTLQKEAGLPVVGNNQNDQDQQIADFVWRIQLQTESYPPNQTPIIAGDPQPVVELDNGQTDAQGSD